jgi:tRNA U34 5-carboxymethylaminomethyl modifying enzyme MnmG/GidA
MDTKHFTDQELINYTIKYSNDPEKIRLATAMERIEGAIIDDLVDAGMDETYCTFRSEWGGEYHPGRYISLLEDEIRHRDESICELIKERDEFKTRSIMDFIQEVNQELTTAKYLVKEAQNERELERQARRRAERELEVWDVLTNGKQ